MTVGIDYGCGTTNIDHDTGIRFGVIPANDITQAWSEASEGDYGPPSCPKCGNEAVPIDHADVPDLDEDAPDDWDDEGRDHACPECRHSFDSQDAYGEEAIAWSLDDGEYRASQSGDDSDVFVLKSPYYTFGPFCSPCAPGAIYLRDAFGRDDILDRETGRQTTNIRAYCFAPDWFEWWPELDTPRGEWNGKATSCPYPVYRVSDGELVYTPPA